MDPSDSPKQHAAAAGERTPFRFAQATIERLFEFSPDAILVTDSRGIVRAANPRALELFGYADAELIGQPVEDACTGAVPRRPSRTSRKLQRSSTRPPDGRGHEPFWPAQGRTEFPVDIMLKPVETNAGPAVVSFVRDVTEQRAAQEALRRNDQQLRSVVESVRDYAIYYLDRDGCVMTWNPGAERIKG